MCCKCKIVTIGELIDYPTEASNKPQVKIYYALLFCFKNIYRSIMYKMFKNYLLSLSFIYFTIRIMITKMKITRNWILKKRKLLTKSMKQLISKLRIMYKKSKLFCLLSFCRLHKEIDKTSLEIKKELETNITNDVSIVNKNVEVLIVLRKEYEHYHGLINSVINNSGAINLINLSKYDKVKLNK